MSTHENYRATGSRLHLQRACANVVAKLKELQVAHLDFKGALIVAARDGVIQAAEAPSLDACVDPATEDYMNDALWALERIEELLQ